MRWTMTLSHPGNDDRIYEIEYRRAEGSELAGYYLFGPFEDFPGGRLLDATTTESAKYEAVARVAERCPFPDAIGAIVKTAER